MAKAKTVAIKARNTRTGEDLSGTYPLVSATDAMVIVDHPKHGQLKLPRACATNLPASAGAGVAYDELVRQIKERFDVLDGLAEDIINGERRALIVSGAAGVGKTHMILSKLDRAKAEGCIKRYTSINGTASTIGLYMLLWEHRNEGDVLLLDDSDGALENMDTLNLLKAALDTGEKRTISYVKEASALALNGVPKRFEFKGRMIFISNIDFDAVIDGGGKLAPHLSALVSRTCYLDTGLHSVQALLARIEQVCRETDMLRAKGLTDEQVDEVVRWIKDNAPNMRSLSLRAALDIAVDVKTKPNWRDVVNVTHLKATKRRV